MKKVIIDKIDGYNYYLKDSVKTYNLNIEFYGLDNPLKQGDVIYMTEKLLEANEPLTFGNIHEKYGKEISNETIEEIIIIQLNNGYKYYLKRLYG